MEQSVLSSSAEYIYIDTFSAMDPLLEAIGQANRVALDIEADSLHHYFEKVCLIQLSIGSSHYIVDPLAVGDLSPLLNRLADKALILHDGGYDLRMLRASFGFVYPGPLFDTQLAAQLSGYERFSLVSLVDQLLGVKLSKSGQKSDWSVRPLTAKQIQYAVNDTRHLEAIADIFSDQLAKSGRSDWLRQSAGAQLESIAQEKAPRNANDMWRIKGLRELERRPLAFVSQLWSWREDQARQIDRPPFKVMDNALLRELAIWAEANPDATMDRGPKLPRHCTGSRLETIKQAIQKARTSPPEDWPEYPTREAPKPPNPLVKKFQTACSNLADGLGIAPTLVASRATLEGIAQNRPRTMEELLSCPNILPWQGELLLPDIQKIIQDSPPRPPVSTGI